MGGIEAGVGDSDSTQKLCRRIREGDKAAEATLLGRLQPGLRLILHRATGGDLQLARELSQETLIIVLKRLRGPGLDDPSGLAAFAAQTARNLAIADRRKTWRRRTHADTEALELTEDSGSAQADQLASGRLGELVRRLLLQLSSDRDRLILTRFYLHEEDKATICHDLELSELAFNQVLFRARGRFRQLLTGAGLSKDDLLDSDMRHGP